MIREEKQEKIWLCRLPAATQETAPLVFDSPHSGQDYPEDFNHTCPLSLLRQTEDSYVDELFGHVSEQGAAFLAALFPRAYIDPNRSLTDIDPELLDERWPGPVTDNHRSRMGVGLVRRLCRTGIEIYDRKLSVTEIQNRITGFYTPYHQKLESLIDQTYAAYNFVWHINCHSMPSYNQRLGKKCADFVLGTRDGTSCGSALTRFAADTLKEMGYNVALNDPFKGVELVRRYANPPEGRHSLQIEINRALYMNEHSLEKTAGFAPLKQDIRRFTGQLCGFGREQLFDLAAD